VRILTPRTDRRLARAMHAFGPLTAAFFSVLGAGARERCIESDLGLGYPVAIEADRFARTFEMALETRGVPFSHIGGEDRDVSLGGARWIVCATAGGVNPELFRRLEEAAAQGTIVTLGPRGPAFDGAFRPLCEPLAPARLRRTPTELPLVLEDDPAAADAAVARAIDELGLPTFACDPDGVFATLHEDEAGAPRVLFVLNPGEADVMARVALGGTPQRAIDLLDEASFEARRGGFEVRMKPRTVRMLALE
jgi:beta-galactosidase